MWNKVIHKTRVDLSTAKLYNIEKYKVNIAASKSCFEAKGFCLVVLEKSTYPQK